MCAEALPRDADETRPSSLRIYLTIQPFHR